MHAQLCAKSHISMLATGELHQRLLKVVDSSAIVMTVCRNSYVKYTDQQLSPYLCTLSEM